VEECAASIIRFEVFRLRNMLDCIARMQYGHSDTWKEVRKWNLIRDSGNIRCGDAPSHEWTVLFIMWKKG
jgi:hypothetical protein